MSETFGSVKTLGEKTYVFALLSKTFGFSQKLSESLKKTTPKLFEPHCKRGKTMEVGLPNLLGVPTDQARPPCQVSRKSEKLQKSHQIVPKHERKIFCFSYFGDVVR